MTIQMCLVSLLPALLVGIAAAQTPSGLTADSHELQPRQQQVGDNNRRERVAVIRRSSITYYEILRASSPQEP